LADQLATEMGAPAFSFVTCVCSDEALHRRRIEGRRRGIPGWHDIGWDHVESMRTEQPGLTGVSPP
jgi:hypothetical protein